MLERAVAFIALICRLLEEWDVCVGVWAGDAVRTPRGDQLPSKSPLAVIYVEAHRLGNCSKQNKQTSV